MQAKIPVWTWRDAIRRAKVAPLTKLVCLTIANYVSDLGKGAYPSVTLIMEDSGMSNRSVATHLQLAVEAGLLEIERKHGKDGRFKKSIYHPKFPDLTELKRRADLVDEHDLDDPDEEASHGDDQVKELHLDKPSEGASHGPCEDDACSPREAPSRLTVHRELSTHTQEQDPACVWEGIDDVLVENFIRPVVGSLRWPPGIEDRKQFLAGLVTVLAGHAPHVLRRAGEMAITERTVMPSAAQTRELLTRAARALPLIKIPAASPGFAAWLGHYQRSGKGFWAKTCQERGYALEPTEYPPTGAKP